MTLKFSLNHGYFFKGQKQNVKNALKKFNVLLHYLDTEGLQIAIYALKTYF